jgi:hypothetical protein
MIEALTLPSATFRMPSTRWATWGVLAEASERAHPAGLDLVYQTFSVSQERRIAVERSKHLVGREQQLLGCPGWLRVRLAPF